MLAATLVATGCAPWTQRLGDNTHSSRTADAGLTASGVATLKEKWRYKPGPCNGVTTGAQWFATPVTFKGVIYIGDDYGCLHAIDEATGHVLWTRPNVFVESTSCGQPLGIVSSINVADDGTGRPVLYFHAPDGYLYKLRGSDGATIWRSVVMIPSTTENDVYAWSSPTVAGNKVIVGISSNCDVPFVQGQVRAYDTATGRLLWTHKTIPDGYAGAGDWYDAAVDTAGDVYVTTGSTYDDTAAAHPNTTPGFEQYSILKLNGATGALIWKAPAPQYLGDPDYGTSPILFDGGGVGLVGAWNKDGWFRAFRRDTGAFVWQAKTGTAGSRTDNAIAGGAVFDGHRLFVASNGTKVGGTWTQTSSRHWEPVGGSSVPGSVRELDPGDRCAGDPERSPVRDRAPGEHHGAVLDQRERHPRVRGRQPRAARRVRRARQRALHHRYQRGGPRGHPSPPGPQRLGQHRELGRVRTAGAGIRSDPRRQQRVSRQVGTVGTSLGWSAARRGALP